jgi:hypothetical protein
MTLLLLREDATWSSNPKNLAVNMVQPSKKKTWLPTWSSHPKNML